MSVPLQPAQQEKSVNYHVKNAKVVDRNGYIMLRGVIEEWSADGTFIAKHQPKLLTGRKIDDIKYFEYVQVHARQVLLQLFTKKLAKAQTLTIPKCETLEEFGPVIIQAKRAKKAVKEKDYLPKFEKYIRPYFGKYQLDKIQDPLAIDRWYQGLESAYGPDLAYRSWTLLKSIMNRAKQTRRIDYNPFDGAEPRFKPPARHRETYSVKEMAKILDGANSHSPRWFFVFLVVLYGTGRRINEVMVLKKSDLIFDEETGIGEILVRRSIYDGEISEFCKDKQQHRVDMLPYLHELLMDYTANIDDEGWLFPSRYGKPFSVPANIKRPYFTPLLKKVGVKDKSMQSTRHTFATLMTSEGFDFKWIQRMNGNSEQTLKKVYIQHSPASLEKLNKANNILFSRNKSGTKQKNAE